MRTARTLAIKAALISGIAGAALSGPAVAISTAIAPATVAPAAAAVSAGPNMYHA